MSKKKTMETDLAINDEKGMLTEAYKSISMAQKVMHKLRELYMASMEQSVDRATRCGGGHAKAIMCYQSDKRYAQRYASIDDTLQDLSGEIAMYVAPRWEDSDI